MEMNEKEKKFLIEMKQYVNENKDIEKPNKEAIRRKLAELNPDSENEINDFLEKVYKSRKASIEKSEDSNEDEEKSEKKERKKRESTDESDGENEISGKEYLEMDELKTLAQKIINAKSIDLQKARVRYLMVYPNISKTVLGRCQKSGALVKLFGNCDYVISFSGEYFDAMPVTIQEIVMQHELRHINITMSKKGEIKYHIKDHDIKDFRCIIEEHGINWVEDLYKGLMSTVEGEDVPDLENIKW